MGRNLTCAAKDCDKPTARDANYCFRHLDQELQAVYRAGQVGQQSTSAQGSAGSKGSWSLDNGKRKDGGPEKGCA